MQTIVMDLDQLHALNSPYKESIMKNIAIAIIFTMLSINTIEATDNNSSSQPKSRDKKELGITKPNIKPNQKRKSKIKKPLISDKYPGVEW